MLTECAANNCSPAEPVCQQLAESSRTRGRGTPAANGWRGPRTAGQVWWKRNSCHQRLVMAANGWSNMVEEELSISPRTAKACLPSTPPPDCTLPSVLPRPQASWQRQGAHFELRKQSIIQGFGVVLLFVTFFYLPPLCFWFGLLPTPPVQPAQQCCFWSG